MDDEDLLNKTNKRKSDSEEDTQKPKRRIIKDSSEESSEYENSDDESDSDYFEDDTNLLQETIVKNILDNLTRDQRKALEKKIQRGVESSFSQLNDIVEKQLGSLVGLKPTNNMWKLGMGQREMKKYAPLLRDLRALNARDKITIQRVLDTNLDNEQKRHLLNMYDVLQAVEPYSAEWLTLTKQINSIIDSSKKSIFTPAQLEELHKKEQTLKKLVGQELPLKARILSADIDDQRKAAIYEKYLLLQKTPEDSVTSASLEEWIEEALKTPYTKTIPTALDSETPGECLIKLKKAFGEKLSEMSTVLEPLLTIFNNRLHNPNSGSTVIGLLGSPGVGKCLGRDTPVLMYDSTVKMVQDIQPGDLLMGDDSTSRRVVNTVCGQELMYTVKQEYGDDYRVNESHILSLQLSESPTISESNNMLIVTWFDYSGDHTRDFSYTSGNYEHVCSLAETYSSIQPHKGHIINISIVEYLSRSDRWKKAYKGYKVAVEYPEQDVQNDPYLLGQWIGHAQNDDEDIPQEYMHNCTSMRKAMLAGLMNSMGATMKLENQTMANKILSLARSVGYVATYSNGQLDIKEGSLLYNITVVPDKVDDYYGFQITGNRRFVLGDYTVTHNTAIGKVISESWGLPFQQISLGGVIDSSVLDGQHPGWVGSAPGRFAKALQSMGVINGVIFLDEIDKLGQTQHGLQVQYSLLHSTDPVQNHSFNDHYLGSKLPLDLSKTLILCALNTVEGIDPALLNRMHIIKVPDYTVKQKTNIIIKHLFPDALENAGLDSTDLMLPPETCEYMQKLVEEHVGKEGGVRGVKACTKMIVDKLGLLLRTSSEEQEELGLTYKIPVTDRPLVITSDVIEKLYKPTGKNNAWRSLYV